MQAQLTLQMLFNHAPFVSQPQPSPDHATPLPMFTRTLGTQVGNYTAEADFWGHVEDITAPQATYSSAISNGSSDLGGQVL